MKKQFYYAFYYSGTLQSSHSSLAAVVKAIKTYPEQYKTSIKIIQGGEEIDDEIYQDIFLEAYQK